MTKQPAGASITFSDGVAWAGYSTLITSIDSGLTWTQLSPFFDPKGDWIVDIHFLDRSTGLVTTNTAVYFTSDAGQSWKNLVERFSDPFGPGISGRFAGSADTIIVALSTPGTVLRSTDKGQRWTSSTLNSFGGQLVTRGRDVYHLNSSSVDIPDAGGTLSVSHDRGLTWQNSGGAFDEDCWNFAFDSCQNITYLVNEAAAKTFDTVSRILTSTNDGQTWQSMIRMPLAFFSGAIALGRQSAYVTTSTRGLYRSLDHGQSWKPIGGPVQQYDANSIAVINDNILLTFDAAGSIWRTTNSGGDSITNLYQAPTIATASLFDNVAVGACTGATASAYVIPYSGTACNVPSIVAEAISGPDSAYYTITSLPKSSLSTLDSIGVRFTPTSSRHHSATLTITLSDGTLWHVELGGRGTDSEIVTLHTQYISFDTIGEGLVVPLHVRTSGGNTGYDLHISYDSSILVFHGTYDATGKTIDKSILSESSAIIHINVAGGLAVDSQDFFAHFDFYPTTQRCGIVSFGPGEFTPDSICGRLTGTTAQVCYNGPTCGLTFISEFERRGTRPVFRVSPNPASTQTDITSSSSTTRSTIQLLNSLGKIELTSIADLGASPTSIDLSEITPGPKFIRIQSEFGIQVLPLLLLK